MPRFDPHVTSATASGASNRTWRSGGGSLSGPTGATSVTNRVRPAPSRLNETTGAARLTPYSADTHPDSTRAFASPAKISETRGVSARQPVGVTSSAMIRWSDVR